VWASQPGQTLLTVNKLGGGFSLSANMGTHASVGLTLGEHGRADALDSRVRSCLTEVYVYEPVHHASLLRRHLQWFLTGRLMDG
jgi:hypothetical protein